MALSVVAAAALGLWHGPMWSAGGFAGGIVSWLNFRWLRATVERLMGEGKGKARVAVVYSFKFTLLVAVLAGLIFGAGMPAVAVAIGVGAMPAGIFSEAIWSAVSPLPGDADA